MRVLPSLCCTMLWAAFLPFTFGQQEQSPAPVPTFRATSNLVFLDVTVLDKKGRPVVSGLTKDDFSITEENQPQRIFSFEPPETHVLARNAEDDNPEGKAPVTIFVLDLLNSSFQDFTYIRMQVQHFLMEQPKTLAAPAELMVVGNDSLEMLQGYTRSRAELLSALQHLPARLPYKLMSQSFVWERVAQSLDALQQIALQNTGMPGRKNIVWVGHGGPGIYMIDFDPSASVDDRLRRYVHSTANLLVEARMSLFVIYPGLPVADVSENFNAADARREIRDYDPFSGDINFGLFVKETGGKVFYNRNDVDAEMRQAVRMGAEYYTLTYQPRDVSPDGKFRRIRITLRNPELRAVTKAGYYAPDKNAPVDPRQQTHLKIAEATLATIPFTGLDVMVSDVVRHPDTQTAEFTVQVKSKDIPFETTADGKNSAQMLVAAASLSKYRQVLVSRMEPFTLTTPTRDSSKLPEIATRFHLTIRIPRKTHAVRVVIESRDGGRIGTADLLSRTIDAAPAAPTPEPPSTTQEPEFARPAAPAKR